MLQYLCPPDGTFPPSPGSPACKPFVTPLFVPPIKAPETAPLDPPPDPKAHQLWGEHQPKKFYRIFEQEFKWVFHPDPPYNAGSWGWGFDGMTPGPTYHARYGEPVLVRMYNNLPPVGQSKVTFALPSTSSHLHNFHTASESDGYPEDWIDSGEFWDHHYCSFPSGNDPDEKLTTLWYHDHRMDYTAANVYAGLAGFFLFFDEQDSGDENDTNTKAWRLPSGEYDVPMLLHDVLFNKDGQAVFDIFNTDGLLGDKYTVNRKIQPYFQVKRRKYRFRILNGGPSRFYELYLRHSNGKDVNFTVITGDGNFQTRPLVAHGVYLSVAQRVDVIIDFKDFSDGDHIYLQNRLLQTNGRGPTERKILDPRPEDSILRFDVVGGQVDDPSRVPETFRNLPKIDLGNVRRRRTFNFDYNGGLWTVNGQVFDPNRVDAKIERGSSEIWTLRNQGKNWSHPIHSHFTEYILMEVNGIPLTPVPDIGTVPLTELKTLPPETPTDVIQADRRGQHRVYQSADAVRPIEVFMGGRRRDMATLNPSDELIVYMKWSDFKGKYVMHCHNVVHEDHGMMIRWDIVDPGQGDSDKEEQEQQLQTIKNRGTITHLEERPGQATFQPNSRESVGPAKPEGSKK
jgi:FtsP/CotA-like multicopper oxidase with cupredoxin domain